MGTHPYQTQIGLPNTPLVDCLTYNEDFDMDFAQPWSNDSFTWDESIIAPLPGSLETQQGLPTPSSSDLASSNGSETLVDTSFSEGATSSSPTSPTAAKVPEYGPSKPTKTYNCPWEGCTYKSNTKRDLSRHTASRHEGKPRSHVCRKDPHCPRRLDGWIRKDLRDRHEKIHLKHSAKRSAAIVGVALDAGAGVGLRNDVDVRREQLMRLSKEELVRRVLKLERGISLLAVEPLSG